MDEDAGNLEDISRREDKSTEPQEKEERKTPRRHVGKLNRLEASSRRDSAGHAPKLAKKRKRGREDRRTIGVTEEDNDPPDRIRQICGKSYESNEGPREHTCQRKLKFYGADFSHERSWSAQRIKNHEKWSLQKALRNEGKKTRKKKIERGMVKTATDHEIKGESVETIKKRLPSGIRRGEEETRITSNRL